MDLDSNAGCSTINNSFQLNSSTTIHNQTNNQWGEDELHLHDSGLLEEMEREQKRLERQEKHRLRQLEHERRLAEKRQQQQISTISKNLGF